MEKHDEIYRRKKTIFVNNLIGGIAWGLGATVGAAVLLTILGFLLARVDFIPVVGDFVTNISKYVEDRTKK